MERGQVAFETIIGIGIVLMLFVIVSVDNMNKTSAKEDIEAASKNGMQCRNIAEAITSVYVQGPYSVSEISTGFDFSISNNEIMLEKTSCPVLGKVQDSALAEGTILVKNEQGTVVLENA